MSTTGAQTIIDLCSDEEDNSAECSERSDPLTSNATTSRKRKRRPPAASSVDGEPTGSRHSNGTANQTLLIFLDGEGADSGVVTDGLMAMLRGIPNVATCAGKSGIHSTMPHVQQRDRWSCGFRNLQMLLGAIVPVLPRTHSYFGRENSRRTIDDAYLCLPSLVQLQTMLEQSWADGFDAEGASHFQSSVVGSPSQIGAVEVSSYLAFSGIDSVVVQFIRCPESRSRLAPFCAAYFTKQHTSPCPFCSQQSPQLDSLDMARELLAANSTNLRAPSCDCPMLPLYLQWKGHSVSIVGIESQSGSYSKVKNLLIFNPGTCGSVLQQALNRGNIKPFRLAVSTLEKKDCQIVLPTIRSLSYDERVLRKVKIPTLTAAHDAVQRASSLPLSHYRRRFD